MTHDSAPPLVLHVIHHLVVGGMENGLVNLINRMDPQAFRHAIACVEDYSDFRTRITRPGVEVVALHRSRIGVWGLRRELFRLCRRWRPAIVHSRNLSGLDALLPARLAGVPHAVHGEHGWDVDDLDGTKRRPALLRRLHAPLVGRYITVSKDLERYLVGRVGIAPRRVTQIYNGVDTVRFAPRPADRRAALPAGFCPADGVLIGTVGRLQPVKDQATLLRAFAALLDAQPALRPSLRLAVVGDGPKRGELTALAESLGIAASTWFPGALGNVPQVLQAFDVFVLPSLNEGISNTILEAMASGVPVLATAIGGNVELVREDVSGRCFRPGDVAALAALLADYAGNPALREDHGRAARRIAEEAFSLDAMTRRYAAVYDGLLGRTR
ncbi:MAG: TIGR03088 family PEP-CTERM/XrtA system glycosyltransferase [Piscinibacter sp.]|nr:TIGR03088 family PEP-CTERM/XrtA system glycosyltransferase [Piscinibacter sp.]